MPGVRGFFDAGAERDYVIRHDYPMSADGVPVLSEFHFEVERRPGKFKDKELRLIEIMPGGQFTDITQVPSNSPPVVEIPASTLELALVDGNAFSDDQEDSYRYRIAHHVLHGVRRYQVRATGLGSQLIRLPPGLKARLRSTIRPHFFAICGFKAWYPEGDHDFGRFAILEDDGDLTVSLRDKSGQREFHFVLDFALVPDMPEFMKDSTTLGIEFGQDSGSSTVGWGFTSLGDGYDSSSRLLIRGFDLGYTEGDNELSQIAVRIRFGGVLVLLSDQNGRSARSLTTSTGMFGGH